MRTEKINDNNKKDIKKKKLHKKLKEKMPATKINPPKNTPATRFTVDDPVNDIFDDELYDDETGLRLEKPDEKEKFEKPW